MRKLLLSTAMAASMAASCFAGSNDMMMDMMKIYMGGFGGLGTSAGRLNVANSDSSNGALLGTEIDTGRRGGLFGGFFGLGFMLSEGVCLGIEGFGLFGNIRSRQMTNISDGTGAVATTVYLDVKNTFGVVANIGHKMGHAMPFVRFGWANSDWTITQNEAPLNQRRSAFVIGVGADYCLGNGLSVGFCWDYNIYGELNQTISNDSSTSTTYRINPTLSTLKGHIKFGF